MGVDSNKEGKADRDFEKRTKSTPKDDQATITYVAVSPREWQRKNEWAAEKKSTSNWKDVIALDCNDLEQWLGLSTATDLWFSTHIGHRPIGVSGLDDRWRSLAEIAEVRLNPDVFLTSREDQERQILDWLNNDASSLLLQSKSFDVGADFITALVAKHAEELPERDGFILVSDRESWRHLAVSQDRFVLIPSDELALSSAEIAEAIRFGHHVLVCESQSSAVNPQNVIELQEPDNYTLSDALVACGMEEARARSVSRGCCGSTTVLKRLITDKPATIFPKWSHPEHATLLAPYAIFGAWQHVDTPPARPVPLPFPDTTPIDVDFLEGFLQRSRREIDDTIARWSRGPEALFRRFGSHVVVSSREDAWHLLGGYLTPEHLKQFEDIACLILEEDDPAFDLDHDQRWMANIYGKVFSLSHELRAAIVESMTLMATFPTAAKPATGIDFAAVCRRILERVLPQRASWRRWASLGQNLILLAECDPEYFLSRVEQDLISDDPELPKLFQDQGNALFTRAEHTSLLWALETLSWAPEYLDRVLAVLCRLGDRDPGGTYANRPDASVKQILLLSHSTTARQRVAAIRRMVAAAPTTAWKVIAAILPGSDWSGGTTPPMPRWRPWANHRVPVGPYGSEAYVAVVELIEDSLEKWALVLDAQNSHSMLDTMHGCLCRSNDSCSLSHRKQLSSRLLRAGPVETSLVRAARSIRCRRAPRM